MSNVVISPQKPVLPDGTNALNHSGYGTVSGATTVDNDYTVPSGKTAIIYAIDWSTDSKDLSCELIINGNTVYSQRGQDPSAGSENWTHSVSFGRGWKATAGQVIRVRFSSGAAGDRHFTFSVVGMLI